jgi:hypothetical protein
LTWISFDAAFAGFPGAAIGETAMRTFTCYTYDEAATVPLLSFIFAADEMRARELARRELQDARRPVAVEIHEQGKLLWTEPA